VVSDELGNKTKGGWSVRTCSTFSFYKLLAIALSVISTQVMLAPRFGTHTIGADVLVIFLKQTHWQGARPVVVAYASPG